MISSTLTPKHWLGLRDGVRYSLAYSTLSSRFCCICAIVFAWYSPSASIDKRINPVLYKCVLSLIWEFILWVVVIHDECIAVCIFICDEGSLPLSRTLSPTNGVAASTLPRSFSACTGCHGDVPLFPIPTPRIDTVKIGYKPLILTAHVYWCNLPLSYLYMA